MADLHISQNLRARPHQHALPDLRMAVLVLLSRGPPRDPVPRRDARAMADLDIAENLRARPDQHAVPDLRMAVLVLLAGATQRDAVQDRNVVVDHGSLAADEAGRMIEENATADFGGGVD